MTVPSQVQDDLVKKIQTTAKENKAILEENQKLKDSLKVAYNVSQD